MNNLHLFSTNQQLKLTFSVKQRGLYLRTVRETSAYQYEIILG